MKLVVDSNILIAALIRNSTARKILLKSRYLFYAPAYMGEETEKHRDLILAKSGMTVEEYITVSKTIFNQVIFTPKEQIDTYLREARAIMDPIDSKDTPFIAAALAIAADGIWSDDQDFQKQDRVKVFRTKDLIGRVSSNNLTSS